MPAFQRTIKDPVEFEGPGLFSGKTGRVRLTPAPPNTGIVFVRTDLPLRPRIEVTPETLREDRRNTRVANEAASVDTVEHLLSALNGLGIDNCEIEMTGVEVPVGDGSSRTFVEMIRQAGVIESQEPRQEIRITEPVSVMDGGASVVALPDDRGLHISYTIDYPHPLVGRQHIAIDIDEATYAEKIAGARSFCLQAEAEELRRNNLGLGGTPENTIVLGENGVLETELRFPDEFVRHKVLDLIGDLAALGPGLQAHIVAVKSGHKLNHSLVRRLAKVSEMPEMGRGTDTLLDVREIWKILPHRYPFLMIDRVIEMDGYRKAVGIKNVTVNEPFFPGHFPQQPIMPGVLILEAMAQLAGALLLRKSENAKKLPVLLSLESVKFRKNVTPGDQLVITTEVLRLKPRTGEVHGRAMVAGQLAAEAVMKFMIIDQSGI